MPDADYFEFTVAGGKEYRLMNKEKHIYLTDSSDFMSHNSHSLSSDLYLSALDAEDMFESSGHRTRFKELLDCYANFPFFTKGLCKCMYLSAWDDEHFYIILEILTDMSLGRDPNTREMRVKGEALAEEQPAEEYYVYQLSNAFLDNVPFHLPEAAELSPEISYIIFRALKAAELIDQV